MPSNIDLVRAFIAIELPVSIRSELAVLQKNLQLKCRCPAKWVASDSIHLTLSFLGEIPYKSLEQVKQAMSQAAIGQMPFKLALYKLGAFPDMESPRIVWVGLSGGLSDLKSLQSNIAQLLRRYGLTLEEREFCPHLTLARIRDEASPHENDS